MKKSRIEYIVGIDEVGRGPIAGPVAVGAFLVAVKNLAKIRRIFKGVKESKQLAPTKREFWKNVIDQATRQGLCIYKITMVSAKTIDQKGISFAIKKALHGSLKSVIKSIPEDQVKILLDGGLKAPVEFINQKTIIKGDEKEMLIALASIAAKVTRDSYMQRLAQKYPNYNFEIHKGYGTKGHYKVIKKLGVISEHRKYFLRP